ncbi:MAG: DUF4965 domain-containing protein [Marinilabiliales bacterium]|nr:DUF4965 domain-containing protein [Marinilabiliales bacterium]
MHPSDKANGAASSKMRAPAYPLITIDPYTSAWSTTDQLFDGPVRHWTGKVHPLIGALRVDGEVYRFLGKEVFPRKTILPMANELRWEGKFLVSEPAKGWEQKEFDDASWSVGKGAYANPGDPLCGTPWKTRNIWVRRTFQLPQTLPSSDLYLVYSHDDDMELYLNGKQIVNTGQAANREVLLKIDKGMLLPGGSNVIAAHCLDRGGLRFVDFGLYAESDQKELFGQTAVQKEVKMTATQTQYLFGCGPVELQVHFVSPLLLSDPDLLTRPVQYVDYAVVATDGKKHNVQIYFEATPQWAVNDVGQEVSLQKGSANAVHFVRAGTTEQPVLQKKGDDLRIDWGYFYLAAKMNQSELAIGNYVEAKQRFVQSGTFEATTARLDARMTQQMPVMVYTHPMGKVASQPSVGTLMIAYDDLESIQYFGTNLKAWWTKGGKVTIEKALQEAANDHDKVLARCTEFDRQMWEETLNAGGQNYAELCVLAYRQSIAAHKLVKDTQGNTLFLSKENFSNGSIGTVDVTYPSAPLYLKYNPELLKGMLNPIFYFSESGKWAKPFAAHDVGTYPLANGQTYGGDMPVEECGNMLILSAAIARAEGNAAYAQQHWKVLTVWADYLLENGLNPENQLCTDDFAGHFAHNTNLSVKAIMGIAGYGMMAGMLGKQEVADKYLAIAREMAGKWKEMANDGDHFRLTFDQPGTWSQKYNLVWDKIFGLHLFDPTVAEKEVAYYLTKQNKYGLPLDNRKRYTKSDWIIWTATLAGDKATFQKFIDPLHKAFCETTVRVPMTDWFETLDARQVGFQARSVVGGYFMPLLKK